MPKTDEEKRAYAKGYQAGRKKTEAEIVHWQGIHDRMWSKTVARRDAFFCAALSGLLPHCGWKIGGEAVDSAERYVELAVCFADAAMKRLPE